MKVTVSEILYDSHGRQAMTTIPVYKGSGAKDQHLLGFEVSFVSDRDPDSGADLWATDPSNANRGAMAGTITRWLPPVFKEEGNEAYPYNCNYFESNPLSRAQQSTLSAAEFKVNGDYDAKRTYGARDNDTITDINHHLGLDPSQLQDNYISSNLDIPKKHQIGTLKDLVGRQLAKLVGPFLSTTAFSLHEGPLSNGEATSVAESNTLLPMAYTDEDNFPDEDKAQFRLHQVTNALGQVIRTDSADGGTRRFYFDDQGRLAFSQTSQQEKDGIVIYYQYDLLDREIASGYLNMSWDINTLKSLLEDWTLPDGTDQYWLKTARYDVYKSSFKDNTGNVYDTLGKIVYRQTRTLYTAQNGGSLKAAEAFYYNPLGRLEQYKIDHNGEGRDWYVTGYKYNPCGSITQIRYPSIYGNDDYTVFYGYNLEGLIAMVGKGSTDEFESAYATYQYDARENVVTESLPGIKAERVFKYSSLGQLLEITDPMFTVDLSYQYEGAYQDGNLVSKTVRFTKGLADVNGFKPVDYSNSYDYSHTRLSSVTSDYQSPDFNEEYTYDLNGNMLTLYFYSNNYTLGYRYQDKESNVINNQLTSVFNNADNTGSNLFYDLDGNMIEQDYEGNNPGTYDPVTFTYDTSTSRVVVAFNGSSDHQKEMQYDGEDHKILVQYSASGAAKWEKRYLLDPIFSYPLREDIYDSVKGGNHALKASQRFIHGPCGLLVIKDQSNDYYISKDDQHSVLAVFTNLESPATALFNYLPFGLDMSGNSSDADKVTAFTYRYAGHEYDETFDVYDMGARYYDPATRRFLSIDPEHQFDSPYVYCGNNPINFIDKNGAVSAGDLQIARYKIQANKALQSVGTINEFKTVVRDYLVKVSLTDGIGYTRFRQSYKWINNIDFNSFGYTDRRFRRWVRKRFTKRYKRDGAVEAVLDDMRTLRRRGLKIRARAIRGKGDMGVYAAVYKPPRLNEKIGVIFGHEQFVRAYYSEFGADIPEFDNVKKIIAAHCNMSKVSDSLNETAKAFPGKKVFGSKNHPKKGGVGYDELFGDMIAYSDINPIDYQRARANPTEHLDLRISINDNVIDIPRLKLGRIIRE